MHDVLLQYLHFLVTFELDLELLLFFFSHSYLLILRYLYYFFFNFAKVLVFVAADSTQVVCKNYLLSRPPDVLNIILKEVKQHSLEPLRTFVNVLFEDRFKRFMVVYYGYVLSINVISKLAE